QQEGLKAHADLAVPKSRVRLLSTQFSMHNFTKTAGQSNVTKISNTHNTLYKARTNTSQPRLRANVVGNDEFERPYKSGPTIQLGTGGRKNSGGTALTLMRATPTKIGETSCSQTTMSETGMDMRRKEKEN
uniref:Uncharacterized protein n=1 Tax=Parascaris univalens TaxID=6257 RepID=A0A914ZKY2_PARUN